MRASPDQASSSRLRWMIYGLLIATSLSALTARIMVVRASTGETPMLSANDRSRWCTIRSLVDSGSYEIDDIIQERHPRTKRRHWHTIDRVRHLSDDGREHDYSSKPPLFPTMLAGQYWLIKQITGMRIDERPEYVMRIILVITNVLPLIIYFLVLARLVDRCGASEAGRLFAMTVAAFGTFLTTYGVTLNNHLPAAISVLLAVSVSLPIWQGQAREAWRFALAGLFAAFTATLELPALSLLALLGLALFWKSPRLTLLCFTPAAALVAAAFVLTTYVAHGSWRTPYAHRSDGPLVATFSPAPDQVWPRSDQEQLPVPDAVRSALQAQAIELGEAATLFRRPQAEDSYCLWDPATQTRLAVRVRADAIEIRRWDNWYDYGGSYWTSNKKSRVDQGEASRLVYAVNVLVGHHGIFSLTPVWLISLVGVVLMLRRSEGGMRGFGVLVVTLSAVCLAFYLARPEIDRNYGGVTSGFRWMFWFSPLWTICLLPAADWMLQRKWGCAAALAALAISVFSVNYSSLNPWVHPWIYSYWQYLGWL